MYVSITRNEKNESVGCSVVSDSFVTLWTVAQQVPPSMGFSRQEYWSGLPFPSPGDLPNPGIEGRSSALWEDSLLSEPPRKLHQSLGVLYKSTEKKIKTLITQSWGGAREFAFPTWSHMTVVMQGNWASPGWVFGHHAPFKWEFQG